MTNKTTAELLDLYQAKAPVRLPGPQRTAHRARAILEARCIEFPQYVDTALSHALTGEGRGEFDQLMWGWRNQSAMVPFEPGHRQ